MQDDGVTTGVADSIDGETDRQTENTTTIQNMESVRNIESTCMDTVKSRQERADIRPQTATGQVHIKQITNQIFALGQRAAKRTDTAYVDIKTTLGSY